MNLEKLNTVIDKSGVKRKSVCDALGITYMTLERKLKGQNELRISEVAVLKDFLRLTPEETEEIFFSNKVER